MFGGKLFGLIVVAFPQIEIVSSENLHTSLWHMFLLLKGTFCK